MLKDRDQTIQNISETNRGTSDNTSRIIASNKAKFVQEESNNGERAQEEVDRRPSANPEGIIDKFFDELQNEEIDRVSKWVQEHEQKLKLRDQWRAWRITQGITSL